jgi:DNA-binding transcriptional ArsR family regulator
MFKWFEHRLEVMTDESEDAGAWTDLTDGAPLPEVVELESTDPLEELVHRVRGPLLRRLRTPHSAAELAAELDVPVTRLYHHLKVLESAGLIEVVATRRVGAALERRYRSVARSFQVGPDAVRDRHDLARSLASVLDATRADLVGAVEGGAGEDVAVWSLRLRLAEQDRIEMVERLDAVFTEFRDRTSDAPGTAESAMFALSFPIEGAASTDHPAEPPRSDRSKK